VSYAIKPPEPNIGGPLKMFLASAVVCIIGAQANANGASWGMDVNIIAICMMLVSIGMAVFEMYDDS
jgi:hypothetical protein